LAEPSLSAPAELAKESSRAKRHDVTTPVIPLEQSWETSASPEGFPPGCPPLQKKLCTALVASQCFPYGKQRKCTQVQPTLVINLWKENPLGLLRSNFLVSGS